MALRFSNPDDLCKVKAYALAEKEGLSGTDYYLRARELYENMVHIRLRFKSYTLEEKLTDLALKWSTSSDEEKMKINRMALSIVKRCCSVRGKFTAVAKEYYKTYRNLRQGNINFFY